MGNKVSVLESIRKLAIFATKSEVQTGQILEKDFFLSKKRQLIGWSEIEDMNGIMGSTANYRNE